MERSPLTGSRIRSYRVDRGLKQAELAATCEISASYLNLIEHNRRNIGGALLVRIAHALDVDPAYLSGVAEVRLAADMDAAADAHADTTPERGRAEELAARYPGWARLIAKQHQENRRLEQVIERLGDRLTHDPFLSASMHNVLTSVTAIRSSSAILAQGGDIEPEWQARFHRNIFEDSQRLTDATEELVAYLDADEAEEPGGALPQDDLDRWLAARNWHIAALEADSSADVATVLAQEEGLNSNAALQLAQSYLEQYAADVAALPRDALLSLLESTTAPTEIAQRAAVALPTVYRRLASLLPEDAPDGEPYGLVACDASGTLTFRKSASGFDLPRYSAGCPLWPLFIALQRPMTPVSQVLEVARRDEARFQTQAYSEMRHPAGFDGPVLSEAWMLFQPLRGDESAATRVGTSCRICPETACVARREPSVFL